MNFSGWEPQVIHVKSNLLVSVLKVVVGYG